MPQGIITTGSHPKALWPGVRKNYGDAYDAHVKSYDKMFETLMSNQAYEEITTQSNFGLMSVKPEGGEIAYDSAKQGFLNRATHVVYALGFIITREAIEDAQWKRLIPDLSRALAFSVQETREVIAANVYNRAFNGSYTFGDGTSILNNAHPDVSGGTYSNVLSTASDLSEAALEQACIDIMKLKNDRGLNIAITPDTLHIAPDNLFEAERILQSTLRVGTADNDVNALNLMGKFRNIHVNPRFTDVDAWFIRNKLPGLIHYQRRPDEIVNDNDFSTENARYKATSRYSFTMEDPRCIFGSPGA